VDHARRGHEGRHRLDPRDLVLIEDIVTIRPGIPQLVAGVASLAIWTAAVVALLVSRPLGGGWIVVAFTLFLGPQVAYCLASTARVVPRGIQVRNGLRRRFVDFDEVAELRVTRVAYSFAARCPVKTEGLQRLRLDVVTTPGVVFPMVASERLVAVTRMPPVYLRLFDAVAIPITVFGHPDGLWGVGTPN
jgi:hypothetical protein